MNSSVTIHAWDGLRPEDIISTFSSLGVLQKLLAAHKLAIKVNLAAGQLLDYSTGAVTNPNILLLIVETLLSINSELEIYILESDSIGRGFATAKFEHQQYKSLFSHLKKVHLFDLSHSAVQTYACANLHFKDPLILSSIFAEMDCFISLSKMKTHTNTKITGCLKNLFGCLPEWDKDKHHPYLANVIADIASAIRPDISILEACPGMQGNGPVFGDPIDLGIILFSNDPVAVDSLASSMMGFDPSKIPTLIQSHNANVGQYKLELIKVNNLSKLTPQIKGFRFISKEQQFYVAFGFLIQRISDKLHNIGHMLHLVPSTKWIFQKLINKFLGTKK